MNRWGYTRIFRTLRHECHICTANCADWCAIYRVGMPHRHDTRGFFSRMHFQRPGSSPISQQSLQVGRNFARIVLPLPFSILSAISELSQVVFYEENFHLIVEIQTQGGCGSRDVSIRRRASSWRNLMCFPDGFSVSV